MRSSCSPDLDLPILLPPHLPNVGIIGMYLVLGLAHIYNLGSNEPRLSIYCMPIDIYYATSSYPCHSIMKLLPRRLHHQHKADDDDIRLAALKSHPWLTVESSILVFWTNSGI